MSKRRKKQRDNRGLSLLEVLVAVAIFVVAAMALLQGFITSGRINRKSGLYLEATATAQNVMEEIKAKDFEKTALAFNYPIDKSYSEGGFCRFHFLEAEAINGEINSGNGITVRERIPDGAGGYLNVKTLENGGKEGDPLSAAVLSENNGMTYIFNPRRTGEYAGKYYFELLNVKNKRETFDVQVTFDGSKDAQYRKEEEFGEDEKNDYEAPNIAKLDNKKNGFLIMNKYWDENALDYMRDAQFWAATQKWNEEKNQWEKEHQETDETGTVIITEPFPYEDEKQKELLTREEVLSKLKRELIITLYENNGIVTAKAYYKLNAWECDFREQYGRYATFGLCPCGGTGEGNGCFCHYQSVETAFYSSEASVDLKNLYIFYYPNYNSKDRVDPLDRVAFKNFANYPVNLYVIKQKDTEIETSELSEKERSYRMSLTVQEAVDVDNSNWFTNLNLYRAKTKLRTNLDWDISVESVAEREETSQTRLIYKDMGERQVEGRAAKELLSGKGLENREQKDRIYKVSVKVYKAGAGERNYPEDELIAALDGSRDD